jgi:hypothetical protein
MVASLAFALQILLFAHGAGVPGAGGQGTERQGTERQGTGQQSEAQAGAQAQTPPELPTNLARVKAALSTTPTLNLVDRNPFRFYTDINRATPTFRDIVGSFDLFNGPVPHSGMTHREFVQSTRPKDMFSSAGFTTGDILRLGLLSYAEGKGIELLRKGLQEINAAKTEAERKQIRARIERELAALRGETIK